MSVLARATDWPRSKTSGALSVPGEVVGGVDLVLRRAVRLVGVDLDVVLVLEGRDHLAVVGPVGRQRDDVELALVLGGLDEVVHAAEVLGGRGGRRVDAALGGGVGLLLGSSTAGCCREGRHHGERCERLAGLHRGPPRRARPRSWNVVQGGASRVPSDRRLLPNGAVSDVTMNQRFGQVTSAARGAAVNSTVVTTLPLDPSSTTPTSSRPPAPTARRRRPTG